jgi:hypothetical protein
VERKSALLLLALLLTLLLMLTPLTLFIEAPSGILT